MIKKYSMKISINNQNIFKMKFISVYAVLFFASYIVSAQNYIDVYVSQPVVPQTPVISLAGNILMSNTSTGNQWHEMLSGPIPGATAQTYEPLSAGNYFDIIQDGDCWSDTSNIISFATSINELMQDVFFISVFPNPAVDFININYYSKDKIGDMSLEITNLMGQVLFAKQFVYSSIVTTELIDMHQIPDGLYLFRIQYEESVRVIKVIKK